MPFVDNEAGFSFQPPKGWSFVDTNPLLNLDNARGPAKEPSPVRARFDSPDQSSVISVIVRSANAIKPMLLQVTDISAYGTLEQAAQLLVPRGSTVLVASTLSVPVPPRTTTLGVVEFPPRTYYKYEFTTNNGLHVAMSVAAKGGKVYVCGASVPKDKWAEYGAALKSSADTFRVKGKEEM